MITQSEKQCSLSRAASINRKARKKQNPVINTLLNFVSLIALAAMVPGASAATAPVNTVPPVVSGTWAVGGTLTTTDGTWTGTPTITFTYQWQRCIHADGGTVINIPGATQSSYTVVNSDVHNFIRVVITGHNSAGSGTGISITTGNEKTVPADQSPMAGTAVDAAVSATITELTPNTTHYFAVFGANNWTPSGSGGMLGSILSFTTGPATDTYYYSFTGADTFTVPAGVTSIPWLPPEVVVAVVVAVVTPEALVVTVAAALSSPLTCWSPRRRHCRSTSAAEAVVATPVVALVKVAEGAAPVAP